eukprot:8465614-Pyramimonas_sp.AAC.1
MRSTETGLGAEWFSLQRDAQLLGPTFSPLARCNTVLDCSAGWLTQVVRLKSGATSATHFCGLPIFTGHSDLPTVVRGPAPVMRWPLEFWSFSPVHAPALAVRQPAQRHPACSCRLRWPAAFLF